MSGAYDGYDVRALWEMLAHESESAGDEHRAAWNRKESMLRAQIGHLEKLKGLLEDAWRPEHSEAARAFADRVTQTITVMQRARQAAIETRDSYTAVTEALLEAKKQMGRLRAAYDDEKVAWRDFLLSTPAGGLLKFMPADWSPSTGMPEAAGFAVMKLHRSRLDEQARAIMEQADQKVAAATSRETDMPRFADLGETMTTLPPPANQDRAGGGRHIAAPVFDPPAPNADPVGVSGDLESGPATFDPGPFLTGSPAQVASPPVLTPPLAPPVVSPVRPPIPSPPIAWGPFGPPITRPGVIGGPSSRAGVTRSGPVEGESGRTPMSPNGFIGGRPGQTAAAGPRRPVAGGTTDRSARSGERAAGGGWRDRSYEEYTRRRPRRQRDGDELWPVAEGVPPVITPPPPPPPNDPPPGVIGIDR
ncbi:hypothetical protein [Dactylosporangium sp. CS-033363]|uniref:hypothetical protein n=1 Tax=Dactylosporangium sp. CS-033363 TaxID=3239935 RepID=UPI003D8A2F9D